MTKNPFIMNFGGMADEELRNWQALLNSTPGRSAVTEDPEVFEINRQIDQSHRINRRKVNREIKTRLLKGTTT